MRIPQELRAEYDAWKTDALMGDLSTLIVNYTESWANETERLMDLGQTFNQAVGPGQQLADSQYGQKESMYFNAAQTLSYFWTHADKVRKWHNLRFGGKKRDAANIEGLVTPFAWTVGVK